MEVRNLVWCYLLRMGVEQWLVFSWGFDFGEICDREIGLDVSEEFLCS